MRRWACFNIIMCWYQNGEKLCGKDGTGVYSLVQIEADLKGFRTSNFVNTGEARLSSCFVMWKCVFDHHVGVPSGDCSPQQGKMNYNWETQPKDYLNIIFRYFHAFKPRMFWKRIAEEICFVFQNTSLFSITSFAIKIWKL